MEKREKILSGVLLGVGLAAALWFGMDWWKGSRAQPDAGKPAQASAGPIASAPASAPAPSGVDPAHVAPIDQAKQGPMPDPIPAAAPVAEHAPEPAPMAVNTSEPASGSGSEQVDTREPVARAHRRWHEDARKCLELGSNAQIIRCAESYY